MERQTPVHSDLATTPGSHRRSGFTLVELLAVIMIIALLAGLLTPAVMRARNSARNAAIKAEIDMLHMAIMNYKNEYGSFPPAVSTATAGSPSAKHIQRLFPRCTNVVYELGSRPVTPDVALNVWLLGYTGDPMLPITGAGGRKKLFDFDETRVVSYQYVPAGKKGSPYIYIDAASYGLVPYDMTNLATPGAQRVPVVPLPTATAQDFGTAIPVPTSPTPQPFFNADTFQILCAGQDEEFGTDDDLSNFWKGTRKEYLSSLQ
jgi:prepilin-type N-terminal cleavage/methylation domain-containing protein